MATIFETRLLIRAISRFNPLAPGWLGIKRPRGRNFDVIKPHQCDFNQPSDRPKLREKRPDKLNSRVAWNLHRVNDGDAEDVSEIGGIQKNNEKRWPL